MPDSTSYSLYLSDPVAGPALELLRRLIQPSSKSLPHVTVLYIRGEPLSYGARLYEQFDTDKLTLLRPGSFDPTPQRRDGLRTLFIQCESPALEALHHKPDFPDSFLHISLHDGPASAFASRCLQTLEAFPWNLEVTLPSGRLTASNRRPRPRHSGYLTEAARELLVRLAGEMVPNFNDLSALDERDRLTLVLRISADLHERLPVASPTGRKPGSEWNLSSGQHPKSSQEEFWPAIQFVDPSHVHAYGEPNTEQHRQSGVFLTPPDLALDITEAALRLHPTDRPVSFGDPAIGSGVFLASLVKLVGTQAIDDAVGVEADPVRGHLTHERWRSVGLDVVIADFVEEVCEGSNPVGDNLHAHKWLRDASRTLILANPPYVRSQRLHDQQTARWRRILSRQFNIAIDARSDLYVYFLLAAHEWLSDGAIGAWLLPTEFMFTNYGAAVRSYLTREVTLRAVHSYDGPSRFANARVTSCVILFEKRKPMTNERVTFSAGGLVNDPYVSNEVGIEYLRRTAKWHVIADGTRPERESVATIGDLFAVRRGIATGRNRLFVIDDDLAASFAAPRNWLVPVIPRARHLKAGVVESRANGDPNLSPLRWLIDVDASMLEIETRAPLLADYLRSIEKEASASTLVSRRRRFYKQESTSPPRYFFSYMARDTNLGHRFFLNRSRAVILNNYLGLYPRPPVAHWLDADPRNEEALLAVLRAVDYGALARAGRVYVEGLTKVEPRELGGIALTDLPLDLVAALRPE